MVKMIKVFNDFAYRVKTAVSDTRKHGLKYAAGMFLFGYGCDVLYDYCYRTDYPSGTEEEYRPDPAAPSPCGCRIFADCRECGMCGMCGRQ